MQTSKRALIVADSVAKWRFAESLQDAAVVAFAAAMDVSENVAMDTLNCPELADSVVAELGAEPQPYSLSQPPYIIDLNEVDSELSLIADRVEHLNRLFLCGLVVLSITLAMAALL